MTNLRIRTKDDWWKGLELLLPEMEQWLEDMPAKEIADNLANKNVLVARRAAQLEFWKEAGDLTIFQVLRKLAAGRDAVAAEAIHGILNGIWFDLPDAKSTRSLPGFFLLCDLCSEYWVFE